MKIRILTTTIIIVLLFLFNKSLSQNRAPSVYLDYNEDVYQGDILINTLRVASPVPLYTYYNALVFGGYNGDGGGYCGMQSSSQGNNYLFSLWDPNTVNEAIVADYIGRGTKVQRFGGEGTGLQSFNYDMPWMPDEWYSFVTRVWNMNDHSYFGFWIFDHKNEVWHHLVTMDYPVKNLKFTNRTTAFLEDFGGNGWNVREIHRKAGWKRKTNSEWFAFNQGTISRVSPDPGCANFIDNYDGGVIDDYFFIKSGGTTTPKTNVSGSTVKVPNNKTVPDFQSCQISNFISTIISDSLELQWTVDSTKAPQYSYTIELYKNADFRGNPFISYSEIKPHIRKRKIKIGSERFYLKMYIHDIFDNRSILFTDVIDISNYYFNGVKQLNYDGSPSKLDIRSCKPIPLLSDKNGNIVSASDPETNSLILSHQSFFEDQNINEFDNFRFINNFINKSNAKVLMVTSKGLENTYSQFNALKQKLIQAGHTFDVNYNKGSNVNFNNYDVIITEIMENLTSEELSKFKSFINEPQKVTILNGLGWVWYYYYSKTDPFPMNQIIEDIDIKFNLLDASNGGIFISSNFYPDNLDKINLPSSTSVIDTIVSIDEFPFIWNDSTYYNFGTFINKQINASGCDSTIIFTISESPTIVTNIVMPELKYSVFPNPNKGKFILRLDGAEIGSYFIQIINELGRVQMQKEVHKTGNSFEEEMDLSSLGKGNYFVKVMNGDVSQTKKIILQ